MNSFMNNLVDETNFGFTENMAIKRVTTKSAILDMFSLCGAFRNRSDEDCIVMFNNALAEDVSLAMKCLFYLADCRGGQGERRFFRVCFKWLAKNHPEIAFRNLESIPTYRRWDDVLYSCIGTPIQEDALLFIKKQLALDITCETPSLLAKWLPSENASSKKTKEMGNIVREYLGMTHKEYRKTLSILRSRINIVEKLMSENRWDEIKFDKIPSRAGLIYKNAFARRDIIAKKYEAFIKDKDTKVNADVLNPVDIAHKAFYCHASLEDPIRLALNKYWENLKDYYNGREENGLCIVDVSGSMTGLPMEAAVSMGAYIAERGHGPFANHFITFSANPELVRFEGVDITDKLIRCRNADWGSNTDIKKVFDMLLSIAKSKNTRPEDIPSRLYIFSDMEFDSGFSDWKSSHLMTEEKVNTLLESIATEWAKEGYELPQVIFWNLDARNNNIPAIGKRFAYVSGFSMNMIECILSGKDGFDLMLEKLNSDRYAAITV